MKIRLLVAGKTVAERWKEAEAEYIKRIKKYIKFEYVEVKDLKNTANMTFEIIKQKEAELFKPYFEESGYKILLDEHGKEFTSVEFSEFLDKKISLEGKDLLFVVGGPYGFDQSIYQASDYKISLSKMTFSHQMVRTIFLEQLYRAFTIMNNEPYHHN